MIESDNRSEHAPTQDPRHCETAHRHSTMLWSIKTKLTLLLAAAGLIALVCSSIAFVDQYVATEHRTMLSHVASTAAVLSENVTAAVTFQDRQTATDILRALRQDKVIDAAYILDLNGKPFAQYRRPGIAPIRFPIKQIRGFRFDDSGYLDVFHPITDRNERMGTVFIRANMNHIQRDIQRFFEVAVAIFGVTCLVSLLFSFFAHRFISQPIIKLASTLQDVSENQDFTVRVHTRRRDEIGTLYGSFNHMLAHIEVAENELRQAHESLERRVAERTRELSAANARLRQEMEQRVRTQEELLHTQHELVETARKAGMAEIATGVLHNAGNVLNSVNVTADLLRRRIQQSPSATVGKASKLIEEHRDDLSRFLTTDPRGKHFPRYFAELAKELLKEREDVLKDLDGLLRNVEHIKQVIAMQQNVAKVSGVREPLQLDEVIDSAITMYEDGMKKRQIEVVREYDEIPQVVTDRNKVLQILINLISNAQQALEESPTEPRRVIVGLRQTDDGHVCISVTDNGVGIPEENLTKIFQHGFTTKKRGHGFGLHSSAIAAQELKGALEVSSPGVNQGTTFVLRLPTRSTEAEQPVQPRQVPSAETSPVMSAGQ